MLPAKSSTRAVDIVLSKDGRPVLRTRLPVPTATPCRPGADGPDMRTRACLMYFLARYRFYSSWDPPEFVPRQTRDAVRRESRSAALFDLWSATSSPAFRKAFPGEHA